MNYGVFLFILGYVWVFKGSNNMFKFMLSERSRWCEGKLFSSSYGHERGYFWREDYVLLERVWWCVPVSFFHGI